MRQNSLEKSVKESTIFNRKIVAPEHLNPNSSLFGGYLMCWIDEVAFLCARKHSGRPTCVTANIDNISFREPHFQGETLLLTAKIVHAGNSSMEIKVTVEKENDHNQMTTLTNEAYLTFVSLNEKQRPTRIPKLKIETEDELHSYQQALIRIKVRRRLTNFYSKSRTKKDISMQTKKINQFKTFINKNSFIKRNLRLIEDQISFLLP